MATEFHSTTTTYNAAAAAAAAAAAVTTASNKPGKRHRSIFDVQPNFFHSCRLLQSPSSVIEPPLENPTVETLTLDDLDEQEQKSLKNLMQKWICNTCRVEFDSLQDQRSHFKSDFHRFNIKLSIAGKDTVNEEDFDESTSDSLFRDYDISSISGSEDEDDRVSGRQNAINGGLVEGNKKKIFIHLQTGERVSIWKCLLMDESENVSFKNDNSAIMDDGGIPRQTERVVIEKLNNLIHEPKDNTCFRVVLLARGGHFAGCVFDGNSVVAHKTFHRYVIRARAGKKQSSKDASGKIAHSAGSSIRRYNELALKKEIQELLTAWKPYFDASSCIFIHAPSSNRQLLFDGEKPYFSCQHHGVRHVPLTVRRPTLKEAKRLYNLLTQVSDEADEEITPITEEESKISASITRDGCPESRKEDLREILDSQESAEAFSGVQKLENLSLSSESGSECTSTPLHEAARSNNAQKILELLEQGLDPCIKDERGRTPYMLATEKEVRNTFRRYMASNLDKWDWNAAKVPSALTKEMEESKNAKQAEKDAKRKARSKELKKLRKAREKKAQAEAAQLQNVASISGNRGATLNPVLKGQSQSSGDLPMSKEEELRKAQAAEREKRAAAAERRLAAAAALNAPGANVVPSSSSANIAMATNINCSCCNVSLAGKVPFHRYNYKYCSTSCMHVHREIIEDG